MFKRYLISACILGLTGGCGSSSGSQQNTFDVPGNRVASSVAKLEAQADPAKLKSLASDNLRFATKLYRELGKTPEPNLVFSPYSISSAFAMLSAAAAGDTAKELREVLEFKLPEDEFHRTFAALDDLLKAHNSESIQLKTANQNFVVPGFPWESDYLDTLAKFYGAGLSELPFNTNPNAARKDINAWVARTTEDKIKDLLGEGTITKETISVLVNAIYLKAKWQTPFKKDNTREETFTLADASTKNVPMMHAELTLPYAETDDVQAAALPYMGNGLEYVVMLPKEGKIADFESKIDASLFASLIDKMAPQRLAFGLPKYEFDASPEMTPTLKSLGLHKVFSDTADFTRASKTSGIAVSDVVHKAFIKVDEEGTEAAAATAIIFIESSVPVDPPRRLILDHPFVFAIRDAQTGAVLFLGRVGDPTAK